MPASWCWAEKARIRMSSRPSMSPASERPLSAPREKPGSWQRWEMTSIAQDLLAGARAPKAVAKSALEPFEPVLLIDEAELAQRRLEAQEVGAAKGHQEGYARGQAEGYAAGMVAAREQAGQWQALTLAWPAAPRLAERQVADH